MREKKDAAKMLGRKKGSKLTKKAAVHAAEKSFQQALRICLH